MTILTMPQKMHNAAKCQATTYIGTLYFKTLPKFISLCGVINLT